MAIYFEKNELQIIKKQVNKQIYIYIYKQFFKSATKQPSRREYNTNSKLL